MTETDIAAEQDKLWREFADTCIARLGAALEAEFGNSLGPTDEMLDIAHEMAVILAIEMNMLGMADPIFKIFETVITQIWIPDKQSSHRKRHRAQK